MGWSDDARHVVAVSPDAVLSLFPSAARHARAEGRDGVEVRVELLEAVPGDVDDVVLVATTLYRRGDSAEKQAVLAALPSLDRPTGARPPVGDALVPIVRDALRTNETQLVGTAMGAYAATHLDQASWRQGVMKAVFMGLPLRDVAGLATRSDDELRRMVRDYVAERRAAGREVPPDAWLILPADHEHVNIPATRQPDPTPGSTR